MGDDGESEPDNYTDFMMLYRELVKAYNWNLKDIDETNLETLTDFLFFNLNDPNIRIIDGKEYHRAKGVPNWL
jgi:hypothetical protein